MKLRFVFTQAQVERFAALTGDQSPIHVDPQFARKSRYRRTVVHGLLPVCGLAALNSLSAGRSVRISDLKIRFLKPIFPSVPVDLNIQMSQSDTTHQFSAKWTLGDSGVLCTEASGSFTLEPHSEPTRTQAGKSASLVDRPLELATWTAVDIGDQKAEIPFNLTADAQQSILGLLLECSSNESRALLSVFPAELAEMAMASTLVGMKLPGKNATFSDLELSWSSEKNGTPARILRGKVEKVMAASSRIQIGLELVSGNQSIAAGKAWSLVQSPETEILAEEIRSQYLDLGLRGKTALVVGASRGIGAATAKLLSLLGAKVAVHYFMGRLDAETVVADIRSAGGDAHAFPADIRDATQVDHLISSIREQWGDVDLLINCAVGDFEVKAHEDLDWEHFLSEFEISLHGLHLCCQAVIPSMKTRQMGKIINLSTVVTQNPVSGQNKYITVKAAIEGYSRSLAAELASNNIQVNLVLPGMTQTTLLAGLPKSVIERLEAEKATGKILQPIEVAQSIAFLASDWSKPISGGRLVLNQGETPFI